MNSETQDFDPILYINKKFPTEDSLKNLDFEIDSLKEELNELNSQLTQDIHEHAILNTKLNTEIKKSQLTTETIVKEVREIK